MSAKLNTRVLPFPIGYQVEVVIHNIASRLSLHSPYLRRQRFPLLRRRGVPEKSNRPHAPPVIPCPLISEIWITGVWEDFETMEFSHFLQCIVYYICITDWIGLAVPSCTPLSSHPPYFLFKPPLPLRITLSVSSLFFLLCILHWSHDKLIICQICMVLKKMKNIKLHQSSSLISAACIQLILFQTDYSLASTCTSFF